MQDFCDSGIIHNHRPKGPNRGCWISSVLRWKGSINIVTQAGIWIPFTYCWWGPRWNVMKMLNVDTDDAIRLKCCMCHESPAVMTWANLWPYWIIPFQEGVHWFLQKLHHELSEIISETGFRFLSSLNPRICGRIFNSITLKLIIQNHSLVQLAVKLLSCESHRSSLKTCQH